MENISEEDYIKAKKIVEKYEEQQLFDGINSAMYCIECQELEAHDCFCDEDDTHVDYCHYCSCEGGGHFPGCTESKDPYDILLRDGYD